MIIMGVVLLNLLIAVLGTSYDEVYANSGKEFNLRRAKMICRTTRAASRLRPPPPLNLLAVVLGFIIDGLADCLGCFRGMVSW